jgi:soluble epoxide hydrolase/lipid-phosphate phosphatase
VSRDVRDYSVEVLVSDLLALLAHLNRDKAVWVGHDWGSAIVWALASHHPEACVGVVSLAVPYRTLELGIDAVLPLVNREIYPVTEYPYGQFDYQRYYELHPDHATKVLEAKTEDTIKVVFLKGDPLMIEKPTRTSTLIKDGGWFGGRDHAPEVPLHMTVLDDELFGKLSESMKETGFFGATAYYLNHGLNAEYAEKSLDGGFLSIPTLFIEAKYDAVSATAVSKIAEPMRQYCANLTENSIAAGHWVQLEKPLLVNAALARWLATNLPGWWPNI